MFKEEIDYISLFSVLMCAAILLQLW